MGLKLYSIGVTIYTTAYVKAESEEEAVRKAQGLLNTFVEAQDADNVDDRPYADLLADADAPDVTLSPAMTVGDVYSETDECVFDPEEETETA